MCLSVSKKKAKGIKGLCVSPDLQRVRLESENGNWSH